MPAITFYLPKELLQKVLKEDRRSKLIQQLLEAYYQKHKPGES